MPTQINPVRTVRQAKTPQLEAMIPTTVGVKTKRALAEKVTPGNLEVARHALLEPSREPLGTTRANNVSPTAGASQAASFVNVLLGFTL